MVLVVGDRVVGLLLVLLLQSLDLGLQLDHLLHGIVVVPGQPEDDVLFVLVLILVLVLELVHLSMAVEGQGVSSPMAVRAI